MDGHTLGLIEMLLVFGGVVGWGCWELRSLRRAIADALGLEAGQINIKAKTAERLGPVGQCLAIEARAVALLFKD